MELKNRNFGFVKDVKSLVVNRKCIDCGRLYLPDEHYAGISHCPGCNLSRIHKLIDNGCMKEQ